MAVIREHERKETEEKRALVKELKHGKDATSLAKVVCTSGTSSKVAGNKENGRTWNVQ